MDKAIDDHRSQGVQVLCRYGFDSDSLETSRAALKVLANVLLLDSDTRQIFVDLGHASKAAQRMKVKHSEQSIQFQGLTVYRTTTGRMNCSFRGYYSYRPMTPN